MVGCSGSEWSVFLFDLVPAHLVVLEKAAKWVRCLLLFLILVLSGDLKAVNCIMWIGVNLLKVSLLVVIRWRAAAAWFPKRTQDVFSGSDWFCSAQGWCWIWLLWRPSVSFEFCCCSDAPLRPAPTAISRFVLCTWPAAIRPFTFVPEEFDSKVGHTETKFRFKVAGPA